MELHDREGNGGSDVRPGVKSPLVGVIKEGTVAA
jgi:hypothetical protein